jgi:RNA polymerase sigma factor (sigma-70 family)
MLGRSNGRPSRPEIERAALDLLQRRGAEILATARRYSATVDDAEDAYQRALEILITKAPTTREDELVPWLKTVVKHEAYAVRRQRERHTPPSDDGQPAQPLTPAAETQHRAERSERLLLGAEALGRLKPQEVRALLLKAEGYSYREIAEITGWTYTKVNRCLTEGRKAFVERVAGIETGGECERLAPLVSAAADGEASAEELALVRPHLKSCLACRARLREFRDAPRRVAALLPPVALADPGGGALRGWLESLAGAVQHKTAALGERAHAAAELATGQKVAAVAASTAAIASGGAGVRELADTERAPDRDQPVETHPVGAERPPGAVTAPMPAPKPAPPARNIAAAAPAAAAPKPQPPDPAPEFAPGAAAAPSVPPPSADRSSAEGGSPGGGGEFGP